MAISHYMIRMVECRRRVGLTAVTALAVFNLDEMKRKLRHGGKAWTHERSAEQRELLAHQK